MLEAFSKEEQRRDDIENQRLSWIAAHLMNASGNYKRRIIPTDLYEPIDQKGKKDAVERFASKEEKEAYLQKLKEKFGK